MRQVIAIINPAAGGGRARRTWPRVAQAIRGAGIEVTEHFTTQRGDAAEIARTTILHNAGEVLAVGGDGTINEIVNGLLDCGHSQRRECVLSLMPLGSGSDFARNLGVRSMQQALQALVDTRIESIDVGAISLASARMPQRVFINSADFGLGASVAGRVNRSSKRLGGSVTYFTAALREILSFRPHAIRVAVEGTIVHDGPTLMALIVNGRCYGGGMVAAPTASVTDGLLDLVILKPTSKLSLMFSLLPRVYRGAHVGHPAVIAAQGKHIEVQSNHSIPIALDGEVESADSARISILPGALRVRVPESPHRLSES
jgi:diacylglycerol kinase (ATP)